MDNYNIRCRIIEKELNTFWPEWHVVERIGRGAFGDVFRIRRDNYGTWEESALKIIQIHDERGLSDFKNAGQEQENVSGRSRLNGSTETRPLLSAMQSDQPSAYVSTEDHSQTEEENRNRPGKAESKAGASVIPKALSNEIQIMRALRGAPNIVVIEDFYFKKVGTASTLFVRMELLTSFQEALLRSRNDHVPFSTEEIYKIGSDVCTALMYCEKKGIIHRDIKPANLFVDGFGNYKIGDFGASRRLDTIYAAHTMTAIGTISYMAPEVFRGESYNNTVDLYALGLILYQVLNNGRIPFLPTSGSFGAQEIDQANFRRLCGEPLPSLTEIHSGNEKRMADPFLDAIIRKACAPNAGDRFQTAEEFRDALRQWKNAPAQRVLDKQYRAVRSSKKKKSRFRWLVPASAVIVFLAVLAVFFGVFILNRDRIPGTENKEQSEEKSVDVTVSKTSDPAGIQLAEIDSGKTEPEISASYDEAEETEEIPESITDSWESIIASIKDGTYIDKYHIGDTKVIDLGEEGMILMELAAVEEYDWAGNPVPTTWIAKNLLKSVHNMNTDNTSEGGWEDSEMRIWLQESILPLFPAEIRLNLIEVEKYTKYHYSTPTGEKNGSIVSEDTIWIPSYEEIFHDGQSDWTTSDYRPCFPDDASRVIKRRGEDEPLWWWLRSSVTEGLFDKIGVDGKYECGDADSVGGVLIGFSL